MSRSHHQTEQRSNKRAKNSRCQDHNHQTEKNYQDRTLEKKEGSEGNAKICRVKVSYQRSPYPW